MSRYPLFLLCVLSFLISCNGTEKIPLKDSDTGTDTDGANDDPLAEADTPLPTDKDIDDTESDEVTDGTDKDLADGDPDTDDATDDDLPDDNDIDDAPSDDDGNDEDADEDIADDEDGMIGPDQDTDMTDDAIDDAVDDAATDILPEMDTDADIAPDIDIDTDAHICDPETTVECPYSGPPGTKDVGECKAATKTCDADGKGWSECTGEVTPIAEICGNGKNDDCDGATDENVDEDGDGWFSCVDDCCDSVLTCTYPKKVNPGAIEVPEDGIDNDCNGETDEDPRTVCSSAAKFSGTTALDLVKAIDICKTAANGSWGIVGTPTLTRADGSGSIDASNRQVAVMTQFGTHTSNVAIFPAASGTMAALSSGRARDANDPDPTADLSYEYYDGTPPADFTAPYAGNLPKTDPDCPAGTGANDGVMLTVDLKVPTNAYGFSFLFRFFSHEYWQFTCNAYNDFFIAMLDTGAAGIPLDKNISFDSNGSYISVNSNAFFTVCTPKTGYLCPDGTDPLAGTGWDEQEYDDELGWFYTGGATKWLATAAPVTPGETIKLRFVVWDTSDRKLDSLVLVDNFKWNTEGSDPVDSDPGNDTDILPDSDSHSDTDAGPDADSTGPSTYECWDLNQNNNCDIVDEDRSGDGFCTERDCG